MAPAGGNVIASFEADANAVGGQTALVLASGFLTPDDDQIGEAFGALLVLADGKTTLLPAVYTRIDEFSDMPQQFELEQNYPNPFNPTTIIWFAVPETGVTKLEVYNMLGQRVEVLVNEIKQAGVHEAVFDASNLSTGTYLYRLNAGNFIKTEKMILIK